MTNFCLKGFGAFKTEALDKIQLGHLKGGGENGGGTVTNGEGEGGETSGGSKPPN